MAGYFFVLLQGHKQDSKKLLILHACGNERHINEILGIIVDNYCKWISRTLRACEDETGSL